MYLRKDNSWELWGNVHPSSIECEHNPCACKHHVVNDERTKMYSFDSWREAEDKFVELTGGEPFNPFKKQ